MSSSWFTTFLPGNNGRPSRTCNRPQQVEQTVAAASCSARIEFKQMPQLLLLALRRTLPTSAKMQPTPQMSMAGEYLAKKLPHSSGARYLRGQHHRWVVSRLYKAGVL